MFEPKNKFEMAFTDRDSLRFGLNTFMGKTDGYYLLCAPSILVSGYGETEADARISFKIGFDSFCAEILHLREIHKISELQRLGWKHYGFGHQYLSKTLSFKDIPVFRFNPDFEIKTNYINLSFEQKKQNKGPYFFDDLNHLPFGKLP